MRKYIVALAALALAGVLPAAPAEAAGLYHLQGWVGDPRGVSLGGITVSDGTQTVTSGSNGSFNLDESSADTYTLRFTGSRIQVFTEEVTLDLPVVPVTADFTAHYRLTSTSPSSYVSTRNGPRTVTASFSSLAPDPGTPGQSGRSCVKVTDSRTGTTGDATRSGTSDTWTYSVEVPITAAEGSYYLKARTVDCASGLALSDPDGVNGWYTIDNTPPKIPPSTVFPADGGNTAYGSSTRVAAKITDSNGVTFGSIRFELRDDAGTLVFQAGTGATAVSYNSATGWASAQAPNLQAGRLYRLTVTASDAAGNATTVRPDELAAGGGFLVTHATANPTSASIPSTPCSVSSTVDATSGTREATCPNVRAHLAATTVHIGGLRHVDSGYVSQLFALDNLLMTTQVAGMKVAIPPTDRSDPSLLPRTRSMRFDVDRSTSSSTTVVVPAVDRNIGTIRLRVPAAWDNAAVEMPATPTAASTTTCANPATSTTALPCTPDPFDARFVVKLKTTADSAAARARHASDLDVIVREAVGRTYIAYVPPESLGRLTTDADVESVIRETLRYETAPDDWTGAADTSALAPGIRQAFGARYGGDWIDRSVMPSVWRIGVKGATAADQQTLDGVTGADPRVVVKSVPYSEADFDAFVQTTVAILDTHEVSPRSLSRDYETGRLVVRAQALDEDVQAAVSAALPAGVPYAQLGGMADDRFLHNTRNQSGLEPYEGGLEVGQYRSDGQVSIEKCTASFAAYLNDGFGNRTTYGVTAGHCVRVGDKVGQGQPPLGTVVWTGFRYSPNIVSDTAYFSADDGSLEGSGLVMVGPAAHRFVRGKFADGGLTKNLKTCYQGAVTGLDGPFENCGKLKKSEEEADSYYVGVEYTFEKRWCFDNAVATGGDSGGPVYEPHNPDVKLMGVLSSSSGEKGGGVQPFFPVAANGQPQQETVGGDTGVLLCFTSVGQFESQTGLTVQES